jgi:hypothetical protein
MYPNPNFLSELKKTVDPTKILIHETFHPDNMIDSYFEEVTNKIVILIYLGEYHTYKWLEELLCRNKLKSQQNNSGNYFIIVSVHEHDVLNYEEYKDYFTVIFEPTLYTYYSNLFKNNYKITQNKKLYFLCCNQRANHIRQSLYYFFHKFHLIDESYFSYLGNLSNSVYNSYDEIHDVIIKNNISWYSKNVDYKTLLAKIPFSTIKNDSYKNNGLNLPDSFMFQDTFCSVITETYDVEKYGFLSEKTFKAIAGYHPFIIYGNQGNLKILKELGFKTFGDYWDESYDDFSQIDQFEMILHLLLEIKNWPVDKINLIYKKMIPILEYNYNHLFNTLPKMFYSNRDKLFEKILNIINSHEAV